MSEKLIVWRESILFWVMLVTAISVLTLSFFDAIAWMVNTWEVQEEYGHGYIIPFISIFLIWQKKNIIEQLEFKNDWYGLLIVFIGLFLLVVGNISTLFVIQQYGYVTTILGLIYAFTGRVAFKPIFVPLLLLFFMIPLPVFLLQGISGELQLISSEIGVAFIRLFDISVFLEGNVIDLGVYKLQVVEACSGLNYLFPLMTLAFISAYFFTGSWWKKAVIFLSSIPITILMNSIRIGAIGVTVEYWGPKMAEGVLHDFEGWAVFMSCIGILILEMWVLAKLGKDKLPLKEAFGVDFPEPTPKGAQVNYREVSKSFGASFAMILLIGISIFAIPDNVEVEPERKQFAEFPLEVESWKGKTGYLEQIYIDVLRFTDYIMSDYTNENQESINFYVAYYASQKSGSSAHSPRSCIPGGGWRITSLTQKVVEGAAVDGVPLEVNRLVIQKDETKQLVYYWFQQRGRIVTNEYMMKWWLFWDSMNQHRTDGALMRLTTVLQPGQDISIADKRLEDFSRKIAPILPEFVPGK